MSKEIICDECGKKFSELKRNQWYELEKLDLNEVVVSDNPREADYVRGIGDIEECFNKHFCCARHLLAHIQKICEKGYTS